MYKKSFADFKNTLSVYAGIIIGAMMMGAALSIFLAPLRIAPGGMSGLATVLHHLTKIRISTLILIINAPIFALGFICFDGRFLFRSVFGTIILSAAAEIFSYMKPLTEDPLLSSVFGGAIMGFGIGTVLKFGGTTGGTDVLVMVFSKFLPNLSAGQLFMIIDGAIILIAGTVFGEPEIILYSAAALFISTRITDAILEGMRVARFVYIISDNPQAITSKIYESLGRGVTGLSSVSMYTKKEGKVLICAIRPRQLPQLKKLITVADPKAFVIITDAKEVMGNFGK